jgi:hypothetical protein
MERKQTMYLPREAHNFSPGQMSTQKIMLQIWCKNPGLAVTRKISYTIKSRETNESKK